MVVECATCNLSMLVDSNCTSNGSYQDVNSNNDALTFLPKAQIVEDLKKTAVDEMAKILMRNMRRKPPEMIDGERECFSEEDKNSGEEDEKEENSFDVHGAYQGSLNVNGIPINLSRLPAFDRKREMRKSQKNINANLKPNPNYIGNEQSADNDGNKMRDKGYCGLDSDNFKTLKNIVNTTKRSFLLREKIKHYNNHRHSDSFTKEDLGNVFSHNLNTKFSLYRNSFHCSNNKFKSHRLSDPQRFNSAPEHFINTNPLMNNLNPIFETTKSSLSSSSNFDSDNCYSNSGNFKTFDNDSSIFRKFNGSSLYRNHSTNSSSSVHSSRGTYSRYKDRTSFEFPKQDSFESFGSYKDFNSSDSYDSNNRYERNRFQRDNSFKRESFKSNNFKTTSNKPLHINKFLTTKTEHEIMNKNIPKYREELEQNEKLQLRKKCTFDFYLPSGITSLPQGCLAVADHGLNAITLLNDQLDVLKTLSDVKPFGLSFSYTSGFLYVADRKMRNVCSYDFSSFCERYNSCMIEDQASKTKFQSFEAYFDKDEEDALNSEKKSCKENLKNTKIKKMKLINKCSLGWVCGLVVMSSYGDATSEKLAVMDRNTSSLSMIDAAVGRVVASYGSYGAEVDQLCMAEFVEWDEMRRLIVVSDSGNHRIIMVDPRTMERVDNGEMDYGFYKRMNKEINKPINDPKNYEETDSLKWPKGVQVDSEGEIYVADSGNKRVVKYDVDGCLSEVLVSNSPFSLNISKHDSYSVLNISTFSLQNKAQIFSYFK